MKQINPNSLQGKDRLNKMRNLMGKMTINENKNSNSKVELSKLGPDNKVYGIVKENHEYFIKTTDKIQNVMTEDFQYIGGLANKKEFAFESYSKALKKLNLKMISLNEQFEGDKVNVFENDNLIVGDDAIDDDADFEDYVEEAVGDKCSCGEETYCNATGEDCPVKDDADMNEAELNVGTVVTDGPKELDDNTVGDFKDSDVEPDDAPNDKSTGTEKEGAEKATPKKTIKETKRKGLSILDALERFDDIVESVIKKKSLTETKYKLKVDDPSPVPEPQGVNSGEASFDEPSVEPQGEPMAEPDMGDAPSEKPFDDTPFDAGVEADEQSEPKQFIQQLSGKLGQSLRTYTQDVGMDLELEKFAINSLLSATHTSEMDPEDKQDIIKRVETSGDEPKEEEPLEEPAPENGADVTGASNPSSAPAPEGGGAQMGESFEVLDKEDKQVFKDAKLGVTESFGETSIDLDGLCEKYKDNSKLVKELRYYEFVCNLKKVEPDAETIEMIVAGNNVGDHVEKYADVMENEDSPEDYPEDDYMSIADLERVEREIGSSMHSHDMVENDDDENNQNKLSINNKKDSFVDDAIKRMMDDYLNTQHGFTPETKPQPKILPETKPAKVPRRSRPFRVNPNPNPTPKGKV